MAAKKGELDDVFAVIDKCNPYASFLDQSLSRVTGYFDTGSLVLNGIISGKLVDGGIPKNRVTLMAGESMCGKTYIVEKILARAQADGYTVIICDSENAIEPESAKAMGLDIEKVKYIPVTSIEQARNTLFNFFTTIKEKGLTDKFIIAIDSLGNMDSELEYKRMGNNNAASDMGSRAKAMKSFMKMLTQMSGLTQTTVICTNHVYDDPSAMFPSLTKDMPGGKSVIYLPSVTVQLMRKLVREDKDNKEFDGAKSANQKTFQGVIIRALTVKNRFIKQFLEGEIYLSFEKGLDRYYGLLQIAVGLGVIEQTGSTYVMPDGKKLGYYKNWRHDIDLWEETIIPGIEERIMAEWAYSNKEGDAEEVPEEDLEELLEDAAE